MMRDIGKNIRELRLRAGFSQDELAERLFVTRQTVSNYENGRTRPDVEQILHLAEIFGADANAVLYGPPVPESRRRAVSRAVVGGGMTAMLWTGFLLLRRWVTALVTYNYQILPGVILSACRKPLMWGVTGWTLAQLLSLVISIKPPKTVGAHRARLILIIIAFGGILLSVIDCLNPLPGQALELRHFPKLQPSGFSPLHNRLSQGMLRRNFTGCRQKQKFFL